MGIKYFCDECNKEVQNFIDDIGEPSESDSETHYYTNYSYTFNEYMRTPTIMCKECDLKRYGKYSYYVCSLLA
jgi:DNA-directed RNA polymerase subunit RPC12/RpoP